MTHAVMLTAMGLAVLVWRPCRRLEGRAPRLAVAMLLLSAASVWLGSFGLIVAVIARTAGGAGGGLVAACGAVWQELLSGGLGVWQSVLLIAWVMALPVRGLWGVGRDVIAGRTLLRRVRPAATPLSAVGPPAGRPVLLIPGLGTPALSVGLLRPVVVVDAAFWADADAAERSVVMTHEIAHARGRHGIAEALTRLLTAGLAPLPFARSTYDCVRRHLEALADDAAVQDHDPRLVGITLGRVALGAAPSHGLGAAGSAAWRVQRLLAPSQATSWQARGVLGTSTAGMAIGLVLGAADTAAALSPLLAPSFCPI